MFGRESGLLSCKVPAFKKKRQSPPGVWSQECLSPHAHHSHQADWVDQSSCAPCPDSPACVIAKFEVSICTHVTPKGTSHIAWPLRLLMVLCVSTKRELERLA